MIDLKDNVGLDIKFDQDSFALIFGDSVKKVQPAVRTMDQMREVTIDTSLKEPEELYYMYRDVCRLGDEEKIKNSDLRFDITIIRPDRLGRELMKTAGHYHQGSFPELYEVVYGRAICLLQHPDEKDYKKIKDVFAVHAKLGQKIVCLPNHGHILINPGPQPLITSNWVSAKFQSQYDKYKQSCGACYYAFDNKGDVRWEKNKFFSQVEDIYFKFPSDEIRQFGLSSNRPMYSLVDNPEKIDFLNNPTKYKYESVFK